MVKIWELLSGRKTYIMAALYAIDTFGIQAGYWESDSYRSVIEQIGIVLALRAGITASGPVAPAKP